MIRIAAIGMIAVFLALQFKGGKQEYGLYLVLAAGLLIFASIIGELESVLKAIRGYLEPLAAAGPYLSILYKLIGIAYLAEFAAGLCKDAGYSSLAGQIELGGKLTMLVIGMPVVEAVLETMKNALGAAGGG